MFRLFWKQSNIVHTFILYIAVYQLLCGFYCCTCCYMFSSCLASWSMRWQLEPVYVVTWLPITGIHVITALRKMGQGSCASSLVPVFLHAVITWIRTNLPDFRSSYLLCPSYVSHCRHLVLSIVFIGYCLCTTKLMLHIHLSKASTTSHDGFSFCNPFVLHCLDTIVVA